MYAQTAEGVLKMIGGLLHIRACGTAYHQIEMRIDKHLVLPRYHILDCLDVLHGYEVAGIRHAGMPVLLLVKQRQFPLLPGNEDDLVVDDSIGHLDAGDLRHEVDRHGGIVDHHLHIGSQQPRERDMVDIHEGINLELTVPHADTLLIGHVVAHREVALPEMHGKEPVHELGQILLSKELCTHVIVMKEINDLAQLDKEVIPLLLVKRIEPALPALLCDGEVGPAFGIGSAMEVLEVGITQILVPSSVIHDKPLHAEDILLLDGIAFPKRLHQ